MSKFQHRFEDNKISNNPAFMNFAEDNLIDDILKITGEDAKMKPVRYLKTTKRFLEKAANKLVKNIMSIWTRRFGEIHDGHFFCL